MSANIIDNKTKFFKEQVEKLKLKVFTQDLDDNELNSLVSGLIKNHVDSHIALEVVQLAEMLGRFDLAIKMLTYLEQNYVDMDEVWREHLEIIKTLGDDVELFKFRARVRLFRPDLDEVLFESEKEDNKQLADLDSVIEIPFRKAEREESLLKFYSSIFEGREDCFARQWADKETKSVGYVPIRRPLTPADIREHLLGRKTYGIYLLLSNGLTKLGVLDADLKPSKDLKGTLSLSSPPVQKEATYMLERIGSYAHELGLKTLVEFSGGKGYHVWFPFCTPVEPALVRQTLKDIAERLKNDLSYFSIEVFPKQDKLSGKGYGNLVKLPLGVHLGTQKRSYFIPKVEGDVWNQIEAILNFRANDPNSLKRDVVAEPSNPKIYLHPRQYGRLSEFTEVKVLVEKCPALGMIIVSCKNNATLGVKEEKVLFGTLGFLKRGRIILHELLSHTDGFNPTVIDYKLSLIKGSPLGCKRIHSLLNLQIDFCTFETQGPYSHPLLHCYEYCPKEYFQASERIEGLQRALEQLLIGIKAVMHYLPKDIRHADFNLLESNVQG